MAISINCICGKSFQIKDDLAGRRVKCPRCAAVLTIVSPDESSTISDVAEGDDHRKPIIWIGLGIFCASVVIMAIIVDGKMKANKTRELEASKAKEASEKDHNQFMLSKSPARKKVNDSAESQQIPNLQGNVAKQDEKQQTATENLGNEARQREIASRIEFAKNLIPDVTNGLELGQFLKEEPGARLISSDVNDGYLEYVSGNKISKINVAFLNGRMVGCDDLELCNSKSDAEERVKAIQEKLGVPNIDFIPETEKVRNSIKFYMWKIEELGLTIKCSIMTGETVDGSRIFYFEQCVTDLKTLKAKYKK